MKKIGQALIKTEYGEATLHAYHETEKNKYHYALVFGNVSKKNDVFCRVHSSCITGESFYAVNCDCRDQLLQTYEFCRHNSGVLIYMTDEGRGNGIEAKMKQLELENTQKINTLDAFIQAGYKIDVRNYYPAAFILKDLHILSVRLLTASPDKISQLKKLGITVSGVISPQYRVTDTQALINIKAKISNLDYLKPQQ